MVFGLTVDGQLGPIAAQSDVDKDWRVRFEFGRTKAGQLVVARVILEPSSAPPSRASINCQVPGEGVTSGLWRAVNILPVRRYLQLNAKRRKSNARTAEPQRGRGLSHYRDVLKQFESLVRAGNKRPAITLAERLKCKPATIRTWVRRAREM